MILTGTVLAVYGRMVDVEDSKGEKFECFMRGKIKEKLVVGDCVVWSPLNAGKGVIHGVKERRNQLERKTAFGTTKIFAANIDLVVIVSSINPPMKEIMIDRYLVEAESREMESILVLNKVDLPGSEEMMKRISIYMDVGYAVYSVSTLTGEGMPELYSGIGEGVVIVVGQSGVGKTSILNALIPGANLKVLPINENYGHGRHTTTVSTMYRLGNGAKIIDSPGVRTFDLSLSRLDNIATHYKDFMKFADGCKFKNCRHISEEECGVKRALNEGEISMLRYDNYIKILDSVKGITF